MSQGIVVDLTPVLDTSAYADNDVLFVAIEVPQVFKELGGRRALHSIVATDGDDQNIDFDLVFSNATITLGTINAAVSISDADAAKIIGYVRISATDDGNDLINSILYAKSGIGLQMQGSLTTCSLWVSGIVRSGTPTFSASGLKLKLGFL